MGAGDVAVIVAAAGVGLALVNALTGLPFHSPDRSTITSCRMDGVYGL
jgi:hypothetical protein